MTRHSYRVEFQGGSGFKLAGIVDRPRADESLDAGEHMPVAVFSHCFTCNKDLKAITRISRKLSESGIAVLRFDMTGLGGSQGDFSNTNFSTNVADLTSAILFAENELGPVGALIGHSFGGAASLAIAAGFDAGDLKLSDMQRKRIGAVVSLAAPSDTQHLADLLSRMNPAIESTGQGQVEIGGRRWLIRREMLEDFRSHQLADRLTNIRAKVLALHSPLDRTLSYDHALRIASLVKDEAGDPACSLVTLAGADHLLTSDARDAMMVADLAAAFIHRYAV